MTALQDLCGFSDPLVFPSLTPLHAFVLESDSQTLRSWPLMPRASTPAFAFSGGAKTGGPQDSYFWVRPARATFPNSNLEQPMNVNMNKPSKENAELNAQAIAAKKTNLIVRLQSMVPNLDTNKLVAAESCKELQDLIDLINKYR